MWNARNVILNIIISVDIVELIFMGIEVVLKTGEKLDVSVIA